MTAFENAKKFFAACEAPEGWAGCQAYVADGATFTAQSEPLAEVKTVQAYCEWMYGFATVTAPGATYELHTSAYDEERRTAIFFATYHAKHTGGGGPVPPTNQETHSHYVYFLTMNNDNKVERMVKVWNAPWAMQELGWIE
ncbi:MAG: nuclear transport factor 2 family protein [Caldilineaceae bacterium]